MNGNSFMLEPIVDEKNLALNALNACALDAKQVRGLFKDIQELLENRKARTKP
jgi:hypothetical protein